MKKQRILVLLMVFALLMSACTYNPPEDTHNSSEPDVLESQWTTAPAPSQTMPQQTQPVTTNPTTGVPTESMFEPTDPTAEPTEPPVYTASLSENGIEYGPYTFRYVNYFFTEDEVYVGLGLYSCAAGVTDAVIPSEINGVPVICILSKGLTGTGNSVFQDTESIRSLVIPDSVLFIYSCAFQDCVNLTKVTLPSNLKVLNSYAFENCPGLKEARVTVDGYVYQYSLCNAIGLETVTIEEGVTELPSFRGCTALKELYIPDSVTEITGFQGCTSLTTVRLPNGMTNLGTTASDTYDDLFADTAITFLEVPDSVTFLGDYVFAYSNLQNIVIPSGLTYVGYSLFRNNTALQKVYFKGSRADCPLELIEQVEEAGGAIYYYSETEPALGGLYWHYVDGEPVIW